MLNERNLYHLKPYTVTVNLIYYDETQGNLKKIYVCVHKSLLLGKLHKFFEGFPRVAYKLIAYKKYEDLMFC